MLWWNGECGCGSSFVHLEVARGGSSSDWLFFCWVRVPCTFCAEIVGILDENRVSEKRRFEARCWLARLKQLL